MRRRAALASLIAAVALAGCSNLYAYSDAVGAWHLADRGEAMAMARAEYARFRDGNDLDEAVVRAATDRVVQRLDEEVVLTFDGAPAAIDPLTVVSAGPATLRDQVREDLLSRQATRIIRAAMAVGALAIETEADALIAVIYERRPFEVDSELFSDGSLAPDGSGASVALRSVVAKRAALDALELLAAR